MLNLLTIIPSTIYYIASAFLIIMVLTGIFLMSKVRYAKLGNLISGLAVLFAVVLTVIEFELIPVKSNPWLLVVIYSALLIGTLIGVFFTVKIKMIQMPQLIALLNGLGGLASLIVGSYALIAKDATIFNEITALIAIIIGGFTFVGSLIAAGKLHRILPQKPIKLKYHFAYTIIVLVLMLAASVLYFFFKDMVFFKDIKLNIIFVVIISLLGFFFGFLFTATIGGADMPIAISLLNSLSGVAGAISGLAVEDLLLVAIGAIVGASGLLLTQIMCKSMNRKLFDILLGKTTTHGPVQQRVIEEDNEDNDVVEEDFRKIAKEAKNVVIVPGYGMAIAQAQHILKQTADVLRKNGSTVKYGIHPVAGRMPGHMNVLLVEANVDYEDICQMETLNERFKEVDLVIIVGANDVVNPAARTAVDTPIYDMPILNVDAAKHIFIFNYDLKPGYAGVDNPLYKNKKGVTLFLGNALETLEKFLKDIQ